MKRFPISICRMETMLYEFFQQTDHESSLDDIMQTGDENIWGNRAFWAKSREGDPYVLTNSSKINGAAVVLYPQCLQHIGENIGGNYYLLPSSIHEMIIMPENATMSRKELCEMVTGGSTRSMLSRMKYYRMPFIIIPVSIKHCRSATDSLIHITY